MNKDAEKIAKLAIYFEALGARNPEQWATSEIKEGIPQYARFVFLKTAWEAVAPETDGRWIDNRISQSARDANAPGASAGPVLQKMLSMGFTREEITDLVRAM
jgi:hypothetical protein